MRGMGGFRGGRVSGWVGGLKRKGLMEISGGYKGEGGEVWKV